MLLNYTDSKQQTPPSQTTPVVLIHGLFGSLSNLGLINRALVEQGYRTIAVDVRNHGLSPHSDAMSYTDMAADVIALLQHLSINACHFIGHSMGGKVGMQVALQQPQLVASLIVADIAPVSYGTNRHNRVLSGLEALQQTTLTSRKEADTLLANYEPEMGVRAFLLKNLYRKDSGEYSLRLNLKSIIANYENDLDAAPSGKSFTGKALFIKGGNSNYIENSHIPTIKSLFPNAKLEEIADAGHWLHAEKSQAFNTVCLAFLAED